MTVSEEAQEVLESMWIIIFEDCEEAVAESFDSSLVEELIGLGMARRDGDNLEFTDEGEAEARSVIRRHRLSERLLHDVLGIGGDGMEESACKFEHIISHEVEESICTLLGHPEFCPHGTPIPPGPCCREGRESAEKVVSALSRMREGQEGTVAYIQTKKEQVVKKLLALGILPGFHVRIIQTYPSYVFQIGETQVAVDRDIADEIYIKLEPGKARVRKRRRKRGWRFGQDV